MAPDFVYWKCHRYSFIVLSNIHFVSLLSLYPIKVFIFKRPVKKTLKLTVAQLRRILKHHKNWFFYTLLSSISGCRDSFKQWMNILKVYQRNCNYFISAKNYPLCFTLPWSSKGNTRVVLVENSDIIWRLWPGLRGWCSSTALSRMFMIQNGHYSALLN